VNVTAHPSGINSIAEGKTTLYPNPASNKLYVSTAGPALAQLRVYDMLGQVTMSEKVAAPDVALDISGLSNGLYILQCIGHDGQTVSDTRFVVAR
jgi:hypothetical protein